MLLLAELAESAGSNAASAHLPVGVEHWIAFCVGTVILLALDMFVFHRDSHEPTLRESALWTLFWCTLALLFNLWLWWWAEKVQVEGQIKLLKMKPSAGNVRKVFAITDWANQRSYSHDGPASSSSTRLCLRG